MVVRLALAIIAMAIVSTDARAATSSPVAIVERRWFETRSAHFHIYSCAPQQNVYRLAARLEQFCEAYTSLAGAEAVASPPITVIAFPDRESMQPFQPLYHGKPGNLAGFFRRGSDENLIVMALPGTNSALQGMEVIFHEYAHLLFRRNGNVWPLWLTEGMADLYSGFEASGRAALIGRPLPPHQQLLETGAWMPLRELFSVTHESPEYNEGERQTLFYAESWLLTHYLVAGDNAVFKARFGQFTPLLRKGQLPEQAFTNALGVTVDTIETDLRRYLKAGRFASIALALSTDISVSKNLGTRRLPPVEIHFLLGKELLTIGRLDSAEAYFSRARQLAPSSPFANEGLGLLAAHRGQHEEAVRLLKQAMDQGSTSFLAAYIYAREKYRLTADDLERYSPLAKQKAAELRYDLTKPTLMRPDFGQAYHLLGFFEMVQGDDLAAAERQLRASIQLEPENPSYLIALAQAQIRKRDPLAARRTLEPLLLPSVEPKLRKPAEDLIKEMVQGSR